MCKQKDTESELFIFSSSLKSRKRQNNQTRIFFRTAASKNKTKMPLTPSLWCSTRIIRPNAPTLVLPERVNCSSNDICLLHGHKSWWASRGTSPCEAKCTFPSRYPRPTPLSISVWLDGQWLKADASLCLAEITRLEKLCGRIIYDGDG